MTKTPLIELEKVLSNCYLTVSHCFILPQHFKVEVLGVDLSKNMIDIGKQRAQEFKDNKVIENTV